MTCTLCSRDHPGMCSAPWPAVADVTLAVVMNGREVTWKQWLQRNCKPKETLFYGGFWRKKRQ